MRAPRPTYANVTSSLALFIALGGTSYAVTQLPRNSVGNRQLKADAVTSSKIRNGSVEPADLTAQASGVRGPRGPAGPGGTNGAQGPVGPSETIQVRPDNNAIIPTGARSPVTVASVTLTAGSWVIDARASVVHNAPMTPYDCHLRTAAGTGLGTQTAHVGNDAPGSTGIEMAIQAAAEFAVPTQIVFVCEAAAASTAGANVYYPSLLATRVGRIENR